jgi:hypothetical protein
MNELVHIVIRYLVGMIGPMIKGRGSNQWPRENAIVCTSRISNIYHGAVAEIVYRYSHNGEHCSGTHQKQFLSRDSARRYAAGLPTGTPIVVRVKPGHPTTSIMRDDDQDQTAFKLMARFK